MMDTLQQMVLQQIIKCQEQQLVEIYFLQRNMEAFVECLRKDSRLYSLYMDERLSWDRQEQLDSACEEGRSDLRLLNQKVVDAFK